MLYSNYIEFKAFVTSFLALSTSHITYKSILNIHVFCYVLEPNEFN